MPRFLKVFLLSLIVVGIGGLAAFYEGLPGQNREKSNPLSANITNSEIVDLTNQNRKIEKLPDLVQNPILMAAAQAKAEDMATKGYFAHTSPEGHKFTTWITDAGYDYLYAGENLAVKFRKSKSVTDGWMNSLSHRANILSDNFEEIGIGVAEGMYKGKKSTFVVQLFGTPKIANQEPPSLVPTSKPSENFNQIGSAL